MKLVSYVGRDTDFVSIVEKFCEKEKIKDVFVDQLDIDSFDLITYVEKNRPRVFFVEINSAETLTSSNMAQISFLKRIDFFKEIFFVAILPEKCDVFQIGHMFNLGFQLAFIRGCEMNALLNDSFFIGLGETLPPLTYARAREIDLMYYLTLPSALTALNSSQCVIETNFFTEDDGLIVMNANIPYFSNKKISIAHRFTGSKSFPLAQSYVLDFPYPGPWDRIEADSLQKETIETWIDLNKDILSEKKIFVQIYSKQTQSYVELYKIQNDFEVSVSMTYKVIAKEIAADIAAKKPQLIFLDTDEVHVPTISIDLVETIVTGIFSVAEYFPIVIIHNTTSKSEALRRLYQYPSILCISTAFNPNTMKDLIKSYLGKKSIPETTGVEAMKYLNVVSPLQLLEIDVPVKITSFTEHEVTFAVKTKIPMFSVLHFKLPVDFYATIVPPRSILDAYWGCEHYVAIIHGVTEENLELLRVFVNQIIDHPLKAFSWEEIEPILKQKVLKQLAQSDKNQTDKKSKF